MPGHQNDGADELVRAWFGAPQAQVNGREVGAVRSLVRSLSMMLSRRPESRPEGKTSRLPMTHVGVAFDHVIESFRNDLFDGYKTGEGLPEGLVSQFELAERASAALGLVVWPMVEFEADDALATAAHRLAGDPAVERVLITAVDKDLCQCVIGERVVCWDRFKDQVLTGDTADGIPGIPGWGKSSAGKLLTVYHHIPDIPDDHAAWTAPPRGADRLARTLREQRAEAALYRTLATLRTDCPIVCDAAALAWRGVDRPALDAICAELGVEPPSIRL